MKISAKSQNIDTVVTKIDLYFPSAPLARMYGQWAPKSKSLHNVGQYNPILQYTGRDKYLSLMKTKTLFLSLRAIDFPNPPFNEILSLNSNRAYKDWSLRQMDIIYICRETLNLELFQMNDILVLVTEETWHPNWFGSISENMTTPQNTWTGIN